MYMNHLQPSKPSLHHCHPGLRCKDNHSQDQLVHLASIFAALTGAGTDHSVGDGIGAVRLPALLLPHHLHRDALQQWAGGATVAGVTPAYAVLF